MSEHQSTLKELANFLFCSTVYRLFSGALLVSLTWTILKQNDGGYLPLALAIFCSFIPAFITPVMIKRLSRHVTGRQMSSLFVLCLAGLALISGFSHNFTLGLLITNLFVWLMIMSLEASLDMWFTQLQRGMDETKVRRISGATTATSQAALMIGPLLAAGLMPILTGIGFSLVLSAGFLLVAGIGYTRNGLPMDVREKLEVAAPARLPMTLFVPMVLIWPILGAFNFMLPVYVSNRGWTLFELGVLDAMFGLGMALIGVLVIIANTGRNLLVYLLADYAGGDCHRDVVADAGQAAAQNAESVDSGNGLWRCSGAYPCCDCLPLQRSGRWLVRKQRKCLGNANVAADPWSAVGDHRERLAAAVPVGDPVGRAIAADLCDAFCPRVNACRRCGGLNAELQR